MRKESFIKTESFKIVSFVLYEVRGLGIRFLMVIYKFVLIEGKRFYYLVIVMYSLF